MRLVLYPPVEPQRLQQIVAAAGQIEVINAHDENSALAAMPAADGFVGKITPPLLAAAKRLRWVQSPTASLEHYLFPALTEHPCTLTNMRGIFSDVIADHVMGYVLCFARNLHVYLRQQRDHRWSPVGGEQARQALTAGVAVASEIDRAHLHLPDCTLGVVGMGAIGGEVARRASAFGMRVVGVDVVSKAMEGVADCWDLDRLPYLLAQSDFVVICAPHTPRTAGMFDYATLAQMKSSAFLVNIGRGVIVVLNDLVRALRERRIAGAALDVFETEPLPAEHPLWTFDNVILTPHVAAASPHIARRHLEVLLDNVRRFAAGQPLRNIVDKLSWF